MRTLLMSLFLALPLVFTACENNDNSNNGDNDIVGTWKNTGSLPQEVSVTGNESLKVKIGNDLIATSGDGHSITFYANGKVFFDGIDENATYTINGNKMIISYSGVYSYSSNFKIDGQMLTIYKDVTEDYINKYPNDSIDKVIVTKMYGKM
jgi:heat shock protein HslJ